jgi:hypothetical protein
MLAPLGTDASFVLVARPFPATAAAAPGATPSPVVFAWGRRDAKLWAELDLADQVLREVARVNAGF